MLDQEEKKENSEQISQVKEEVSSPEEKTEPVEKTAEQDINPTEEEAKPVESEEKPTVKEEKPSELEKNPVESEKEPEKKPSKALLDFRPGDTVRVFSKLKEKSKKGEERIRLQSFEGIVIYKKGRGVSKTFCVRKIASGNIAVERIWPLYSPNIERIEIVSHGKVRRAKLYYLRGKVGKAASKVKEATVSE